MGQGAPAAVGFLGIGVMGGPMARRLLEAGVALVVWNRTVERCAPLRDLGAEVADDPAGVFDRTRTVLLMMFDERSTDAVLGRGTAEFERRVRGHLVVHMGTTSPGYSRALDSEIRAAGGRYAEAPVSGSRQPAETGRLVAMLAAADPRTRAEVVPLLAPMCREVVECGAVPNGTSMKLAVNAYMIGLVTALAEGAHLAVELGLDLALWARVLEAGPMDNALARIKADKLVRGDFEVQAAITDVLKNTGLVRAAAEDAGVDVPLTRVSDSLYAETAALGHGSDDMIAVVEALRARTERRRQEDAAQ